MSIKPVKGLRSHYPTDKGPIDTYQLGHNGRVEYIAAEVALDHLDKGNDTTDEWHKWARERGLPSDEAGLILSSRLGGSGSDKTNLFPKGTLFDSTTWKEHEQTASEEASEMKKWKKIKFVARLDYPSDDGTRPSAIEYQYDLPSGTVLHGKVNNEAGESSPPKEEEVEEEEEEEEEEVEEEEEEEAVDEPQPAAVQIGEVKAEKLPTPVPSPEPPKSTVEERAPSPIVEKCPPSPPPVVERFPTPPPPKPVQPSYAPAYRPYEPPAVAPALRDNYPKKEPPSKAKPAKEIAEQKDRGVITKSDLIDLIPVIGSCKLAVETLQAVYNGNGKLAMRKAFQCGISLVADFYLGRAIARHGEILAKAVTEQTVLRFVTKAENQIIIVGTFKTGNQLLSTLSRALS